MTRRTELHSVEKILRRPAVEDRTGLSRSSIYESITAGTFPPPVKLSARAVGWRKSDIDAWIESRQLSREVDAT